MYVQRSSISTFSLCVSIGIIALFVGIMIMLFHIEAAIGGWLAGFFGAILVGSCLSSLCFCPMKTAVGDGKLEVIFSFRTKTFRLSEIASVTPYMMPKMTVRLCGSGAFFGWWGWFSNKPTGRFMMYAANLNQLILVQLLDGRKYVISCSDPQAMTDAIIAAARRA